MEEFDALRALHEGLVDGLAHEHGAHRHAAVGQPLGERDHVGRNAKLLGGKCRAGAAEARDHLIENQQDPVAVADLAQALQIPARRDQHTGGTGDGLDDHRGNVGRIMQRHQPLELIRQLRPVRRRAARERVPRRIMRVRQVVDAR